MGTRAKMEKAVAAWVNVPKLTRQDVVELYGISERTLDRWVASGKLPRPMKLRSGAVRWCALEIIKHEFSK
ncbi:MAG: AlpA family phage regulatory protein [Verrucomicrobiae bacterium]|nr:AlpA family phage regulatory protein [Verrucomicrobiae bacterium]